MAKTTGSFVYRLNLPIPGGVYLIGDMALQREMLLDPTTDKPLQVYKSFSKIGGTPNVFTGTTSDPHWKTARKGSAPAFSAMEVNRMTEICNKYLDEWIENTLQPLVENNQSFDPSEEMVGLVFKAIMETAFEYQVSREESEEFMPHLEVALREFTFAQTVNPLRRIFGFFIPGVRRASHSCFVVRKFAQKVLDHYRSKPDKSPHNTLIKLIENNEGFPNDSFKVSELVTSIVDGHDTTGFSLSSTLVLLAKHPEFATKVRESLQGLPSPKPSDYLRFCINESNRLVPVAAMGSIREAGRDYSYVDPKTQRKMRIPKGAVLFMPQFVGNRNASVYENPDTFNPDRWISPSQEMKDSLLTFGLGNRNCIGQSLAIAEMNSVLSRLLSEYSLELEEEGELDYFLTLKYSGVRLKAHRVN